MRGLWFEDGQVRLRTDVPRPKPTEGQSRVRVLQAGVCATDLALRGGYMGFSGVPGHEFVGVALDGPLEGERVVGEINLACGTCATCRAGLPRHCPTRTVLGILHHGGAFAEELVLPLENLHRVPDGVSDAAATFTEPLAAAFEIPEQVDVVGARALVVGDGRLGMLCAQVLARRGATVEVVGRHPDRARLTGQEIRWVAPPSAPEHDLVVEATGRPDVLQQAMGWVRPRGTLVLKTTAESPAALDLAPLVVNEVTLVGSRCGPFSPALELLASGEIDVEGMVDVRLPLERAAEALDQAARPGVLKVLIQVS